MNTHIRLSVFISFLSITCAVQANPFSTITEVRTYADRYPEYVEPQNGDWLRPDFRAFHKKRGPNILQRLWMRLGFQTKGWNGYHFEQLLQSIVSAQEKSGFKNGEFAERYTPAKDDTFIIFGDVYGAFHSLSRDITFLQSQGIIDEALKIKSSYYFIFNGNVIAGSPYIVETLTLILQLMAINPSQVIYTRGYYEAEERWKSFELINELKTFFGSYTSRYEEVMVLLGQFFESLPIALYLTQEKTSADKTKNIDVVVISSNDQISTHFNASSLAHLTAVKEKRGYFYYAQEQPVNSGVKIDFRAFITGEDRTIGYHITDGLTLIGAIEGAIRWLVFSSPTERNQKLYKFTHDAFAQLHITNGMNTWTIALYNQKVPELKGFKVAGVYNVESGHAIRKGEVGAINDLFFGASMDLSKGASPIGKRVQEGLNLAFVKEQTEKTIPDVVVKLTTVNDEYTPQKTRAAVEDFIKKGINFLIGSQGSASLEAYLDLIEDEKLLVLFPFTGAPEFRKPNLSHLIHYRGSYIREGEELVRYALKDLKARNIAIFYQDDAFGRGALEGARRALKEAGIAKFLEIPHERNVVNYAQQAAKIQDFNPDTILFSTNALAIRGLIRQMGVQYFAGKNLLGLSVYEDAFERFLKDKGLSFTLIRMVPDPRVSNLPIAKEYRKWADAHNYSYDRVAFEQFINASILFEILRNIKGPITKEKIIAVAEKMKQYPFKGLTLTFNPETRELSDTLWIDTGNGDWIEKRTWNDQSKHLEVRNQKGGVSFGSLLDLSSGVRLQGRAVKEGIELRLSEMQPTANKETLSIKIVDDQYNPETTKKEVAAFLKEGINVIVCPIGSPTLESYIDLVKKGEIAVLFPITGAPIFRAPDLISLVNLRASYATEGMVLAHYVLDQMKPEKVVMLYQDDVFGKGLLEAAQQVFASRNFENSLALPYERNTLDFTEQAQQARTYNPDTILFFSTSIAARNFIRQLGLQQALKLKMAGNSDMGESLFINFVKDTGLHFVYLNVVPNPQESQLPIVKQYRSIALEKNKTLDPFSLEAYIGVDILLHVLHTMVGEVTKEKIIQSLTNLHNKEYKGLLLNFDSETRTLLHTLWLDEGSAQWKMINTAKYNNIK